MNLQAISKAIAATLAGVVVSFLMKHNIVIADKLPDSIEIILAALITGVVTYLAPKNKGTL